MVAVVALSTLPSRCSCEHAQNPARAGVAPMATAAFATLLFIALGAQIVLRAGVALVAIAADGGSLLMIPAARASAP